MCPSNIISNFPSLSSPEPVCACAELFQCVAAFGCSPRPARRRVSPMISAASLARENFLPAERPPSANLWRQSSGASRSFGPNQATSERRRRIRAKRRPKRIKTMRRHTSHRLLAVCLTLTAAAVAAEAQVGDILRQQQQPNPLANIQLPPQLASLTPEQLHHLAQLRELQLQREASAARQSGQEQSSGQPVTSSPASSQSGAQIPQPSTAGGQTADQNERHDDGAGSSYGEPAADSEAATGGMNGGGAASNGNETAPTFEVNWNKCPQLEPSEAEKQKKSQVITGCLQAAPIPQNLTRENVEQHREQIASCALKAEGWFDERGDYRYEKAESEIRAKRLDGPIELQVLKFHVACREEASKKFPRDQNKLIDQVQFYQACMDYYISIVCEIEVSVDQ